MKSIEEFSFADEPGKIQTKANIKQTIERPRISIVTPFYNAERNFEQTYHCVINQSMQEFEWVIVDDDIKDVCDKLNQGYNTVKKNKDFLERFNRKVCFL